MIGAEDYKSTNVTNGSVLRETKALQEETMAALDRIHRSAAEAKEVGTDTLAELHDQTDQINNTETRSKRLKADLEKANEQQNRLAMLRFRMGTRRKAKKKLKKEEKLENHKNRLRREQKKHHHHHHHQQQQQSTFQRRGPRPKKVVSSHNENENDAAFGKENNSRVKSKNVPQSDQDQRDLHDIETTDNIIDERIDALGNEVEELLELSINFEEVVKMQNTKVELLNSDLDITNFQNKLLNKRLDVIMKWR